MVSAAGPTPENPQLIQFLSLVLWQRGPSSLPYSEDTKCLIRTHLVSLTSKYPCLDPKTATFTHNDGRSVNLLQADGTIPMSFHGVTYNIPVIIWLTESYPHHPPCVYVNPMRDMVIKSAHAHVNPSGLVSIPYLHNWVYPSSNLVELAESLTAVFGQDPPLFSIRRPNPNPDPNPNPTPGHSFSAISRGSVTPARPAIPKGHTRRPLMEAAGRFLGFRRTYSGERRSVSLWRWCAGCGRVEEDEGGRKGRLVQCAGRAEATV
ncbi:hypothetical protein ACE6H2_005777 [Prunus campanulata]